MDQRRVLLGVGLSIVFLVLYQELVLSRYSTRPAETTRPTADDVVPAAPPVHETAEPQSPPSAEPAPAEGGGEVSVETDLFSARINLRGGNLQSFRLKRFRRDVTRDSDLLDLVRSGPILPLTGLIGPSDNDANVLYSSTTPNVEITGTEQPALVLRGVDRRGARLEKQFRFRRDRYDFEVTLSVDGAPAEEIGLVLSELPAPAEGGGSASIGQAVVLAEGRLIERKRDKIGEVPGTDGLVKNVQWAGFAAQYFLAATIPAESDAFAEIVLSHNVPTVQVRSEHARGRAQFSVFLGPKSRENLVVAGHDLDRALDFGWFWFIAVPLLEALRLIERLTGNWGVAIILLTALVKLATVPLTQSTFKNMTAMRTLQPQIEGIRTRHKDDQMAQQREIMELYKRHGLNPLSGCLPMFLQLPVFVGLYNALSHAIELRHAPFVLWISDLSAPDRLPIAGVGIPVLTLLMGASMLVQQWMTPQQGDPAQQKVMMFMPVLFTWMFMGFPSGLVLYWLVNNVLTIGQQALLLRKQT